MKDALTKAAMPLIASSLIAGAAKAADVHVVNIFDPVLAEEYGFQFQQGLNNVTYGEIPTSPDYDLVFIPTGDSTNLGDYFQQLGLLIWRGGRVFVASKYISDHEGIRELFDIAIGEEVNDVDAMYPTGSCFENGAGSYEHVGSVDLTGVVPLHFGEVVAVKAETDTSLAVKANNTIFHVIDSYQLHPYSKLAVAVNSLLCFGISPDGIEHDDSKLPDNIKISNYPNPFNSSTEIRYDLPNKARVRLDIFDNSGRLVEELYNDMQGPGSYKIPWDASGKPSGIYHLKIDTPFGKGYKKMTLIK